MRARLLLQSIEFRVVVCWFMMEEYQLANVSCCSYLRCHSDRAMAEALLRFAILIRRILRVMDQYICFFDKSQESRIATLAPFNIGCENQPLAGVFDAIDCSAVQRMTAGQAGNDAHLIRMPLRLLSFENGFLRFRAKNYLFRAGECVENPTRR